MAEKKAATAAPIERSLLTTEFAIYVPASDGCNAIQSTTFIVERLSLTGNKYTVLAVGTRCADELAIRMVDPCMMIVRPDNVAGLVAIPAGSAIGQFVENQLVAAGRSPAAPSKSAG